MYVDEEVGKTWKNWAEHGEKNIISEVTYEGNGYQLNVLCPAQSFFLTLRKSPWLGFYRLV